MDEPFFQNLLYASLRVAISDRMHFDDHWCGPREFRLFQEELVAIYESTSADAPTVEIFCCAGPARSYIVKVPDYSDRKGFMIRTGASDHRMAQLAAMLAEQISRGMLAVYPRELDENRPTNSANDADSPSNTPKLPE
jgi:hypothetical protein